VTWFQISDRHRREIRRRVFVGAVQVTESVRLLLLVQAILNFRE